MPVDYETFKLYMMKIILCVFVFLFCLLLIKVCRKMIARFFASQAGILGDRKSITLSSVLTSLVKYIIYFFAVMQILAIWGNQTVSSLLTLAGIGTVALGLGAQSVVKDFLTGFFILFEDQYGVGDIVKINEITGTVEEISMRTTVVRGFDSVQHTIPNGEITTVSNLTSQYATAIVEIGVYYKQDMDFVINAFKDEMAKAADQTEGLRSAPKVMGITNVEGTTVIIRITAECEIKENWAVERELRRLLVNRIVQEKIQMPMAQANIQMENVN